MTKRHLLTALLVAALGTGLIATHGYSQAPLPESEVLARALPVAVVHPVPADRYEHARSFTGEVTARRRSVLGFELAGRVIDLAVDDGVAVAAGQVIARLDVEALRTDRLRVDALRREARAVLAEMQVGPRKEVIAASRHRTADLQARVGLLARKQARRAKLLADKHVSREEYDEAATALDATRSLLGAARERLAELEAGTRRERLEAQAARLAALDAQIARIDVDLAKGSLRAPYAGRVENRHVDEGAVLAAGTPVFTIVEDGHLEVRVGLAPDAAEALAAGATIPVRVGRHTFDAIYRRSLPTTDAVTRTRTVVLDLPREAAGVAVPGQLARIEIRESLPVTGLWIPIDALVRGVRGLWSAFAVRPQEGGAVVVRHHLEVLHVEGERALVRGTLAKSDRVLVGDTSRVVPGQLIEPRTRTASR